LVDETVQADLDTPRGLRTIWNLFTQIYHDMQRQARMRLASARPNDMTQIPDPMIPPRQSGASFRRDMDESKE